MLSVASMAILHRVFPVEYCPKSIKTALHRIFSCEMLSSASWATLNKVFTCAVLFQKYYDNIEQDFFPCDVIWSLLDNIAQGFCMCNVVPRVLRQNWIESFLVQCCLEHQGQHCLRYLLVQCYPKTIKTTLNRIFFLCNVVWNFFGNITQGFYLCNVGPWLTKNSS